jgi:hypothetical protein
MTELHYKDKTVVIRDDLTQGDLEAFGDVFDVVEMGKINIPRRNGTAARAAISAGWISSPAWKVEDVGGMNPGFVRWLGNEVMTVYLEITKIDPNS